MFGMFVATNLPLASNTWKVWVEYLLHSSDEDLSLTKGALVYCRSGAIAASTSRFKPSQQEIKGINACLDNPERYEKIKIEGKTYCIKSANSNQIMAFNGRRYILISRSKQMFVIAQCGSRVKSNDAAKWVNKIASKLKKRDY